MPTKKLLHMPLPMALGQKESEESDNAEVDVDMALQQVIADYQISLAELIKM